MKFSDKDIRKNDKNLRFVVLLQIIIIVILIISMMLFYTGFFTKEALVYAKDGIDLNIESVGESSVEYSVGVSLKNTGNKQAKVSVTGEVYISEMGSATGDEMTKVLEYKYVEIDPDQTKNLDLGTFTTFEGWHYVVKVHISWNEGALELSKMLVSTP